MRSAAEGRARTSQAILPGQATHMSTRFAECFEKTSNRSAAQLQQGSVSPDFDLYPARTCGAPVPLGETCLQVHTASSRAPREDTLSSRHDVPSMETCSRACYLRKTAEWMEHTRSAKVVHLADACVSWPRTARAVDQSGKPAAVQSSVRRARRRKKVLRWRF